jgi:hypothetical protein
MSTPFLISPIVPVDFGVSKGIYSHGVKPHYKLPWVSKFKKKGKQSLALVVRSLVVEPAHPGSSPRFGMGVCIYLD